MPGAVIKSKQDRVVASIVERDELARYWNSAQKGVGVLVENAFKDYPEIGKGDPTVKTTSTAYYKWNGIVFIKLSEGEGLDQEPLPPVYTGASPTTVDFGDLTAGTDITGWELSQLFERGLVKYLVPAFSSFAMQGQATTVEVGQTIAAGSKTFTWATTNSTNVKANSIALRDDTGGMDLLTGLANDGTENVNVAAINFVVPGNRIFSIRALNTNEQSFGRTFVISAVYKLFYDNAAQSPATSAVVRAAANNRFVNAGNTFILNTGSVNTIFYLWLPNSYNLVSVIDLDALNLNITSQYVATPSFAVNDAAGTPVNGKLYVMTQTVAYTSNHRHQITIA